MIKSRRTPFVVLLLLSLLTRIATAQSYSVPATIPEEHEKKNAISVNVLSPVARVYSISYARLLSNNREITITPQFALPAKDVASEPAVDHGSNHRFLGILNRDPQYYYTRYQVRVGLRIPAGRSIAYEPQLQLGYGQFLNKVLKTEDANGDAYDEYMRLDRRYASAGLVNMVNWVHDYNWFRTKFFLGLGVNVRRYKEMQWERYIWYHPDNSFESRSDTYLKAKLSLYLGLELGLRY